MTNFETVIYRKEDSIAFITLNRPNVMNAYNTRMRDELYQILSALKDDNEIRAAILSGAGDRAFCGGSELERLIQGGDTAEDASAKLQDAGRRYNITTAIASIDRPVIAAINGDALGLGLEVALSCDIRLASQGARFGLPQVASGLIPMGGGTQRLPRLIGRGKTLELILTAETISAGEALEIGLVSKVTSRENLDSEAEALAKTIASKAPIALRYIKEAVNKGMDLTLEQGLRLEADLYLLLHTTADRAEGINAFLEKRPPEFKGR